MQYSVWKDSSRGSWCPSLSTQTGAEVTVQKQAESEKGLHFNGPRNKTVIRVFSKRKSVADALCWLAAGSKMRSIAVPPVAQKMPEVPHCASSMFIWGRASSGGACMQDPLCLLGGRDAVGWQSWIFLHLMIPRNHILVYSV